MKKKFFLISPVIALIFAVAPMSSFAKMGADENFNIYSWQNWSYEWVDNPNGGPDVDRLSGNANFIGFVSHMDTGIDGLQVGFQCEQYTYFGRYNNIATGWCNSNSKVSLRHEALGEIMIGHWLLPYKEIVMGWIDPFTGAGADSHSSIMGNIGTPTGNPGGTLPEVENLYISSGFSGAAAGLGPRYGALSFNRRENGIIQYVWPNANDMAYQGREGLQFRVAVTEGSATDSGNDTGATLDPRIWSTGVSYTYMMANGGALWGAVAYQNHRDISAQGRNGVAGAGAANGIQCADSDDDAWRLAARYTHTWANGMTSQLAGMYENLEYEATGCLLNGAALAAPSDTDSAAVWQGVERDAWMVSGKHAFGNGFDFRFSYMDADELECDNATICTPGYEAETDAQAYNVGVFYTMPAGTELRLTYSEIQNEANSAYNFGVNHSGATSRDGDLSMVAVGIIHWFD